jgi:hypothetical protein
VRHFHGLDRASRAAILQGLLTRDGPVCGICGGTLFPRTAGPDDPTATTIDHRVPLADGAMSWPLYGMRERFPAGRPAWFARDLSAS